MGGREHGEGTLPAFARLPRGCRPLLRGASEWRRPLRNLLLLLILIAGGFVLTAMYVAPKQPELRGWYETNACPHLDRISPKICEPIRSARGSDAI